MGDFTANQTRISKRVGDTWQSQKASMVSPWLLGSPSSVAAIPGLAAPPPPAPDLADAAALTAAAAERRRRMGGSRQESFLGGGLTSPPLTLLGR